LDARAIVRDVIGSVPEGAGTKRKGSPFLGSLPLSTIVESTIDDSVLTVAAAEWILTGQKSCGLAASIYRHLPERAYASFCHWASNAFANLTTALAMAPLCGRAPVGFETIEEVRTWSKRTSEITHNHFEGIRGAQATLHAGVPTTIDKTDHRVLVWASPIRTRTSLRF
jgi:hypothetical protein